jgi:hypothetical protein
MLRGIAVAAWFASACAAHPNAAPPAVAPVHDPELALSTIVLAAPQVSAKARGPRRVGRLSPPFALGAPARNVLARATPGDERNVASR